MNLTDRVQKIRNRKHEFYRLIDSVKKTSKETDKQTIVCVNKRQADMQATTFQILTMELKYHCLVEAHLTH